MSYESLAAQEARQKVLRVWYRDHQDYHLPQDCRVCGMASEPCATCVELRALDERECPFCAEDKP